MAYMQQGGLSLTIKQNGAVHRSIWATIAATIALLMLLPFTASAASQGKGFDAYGYNDQARVFVGDCLNWYLGKYPTASQTAAQNYCGAYANDQVVMKWSKAWDACEATADQDDASACAGAWTTNHWNGNVADGSGEVWHYKIIWVGSEGEDSPYWREGGYSIWGNYEVIADHGTAAGVHSVLTHATPNGLGNR